MRITEPTPAGPHPAGPETDPDPAGPAPHLPAPHGPVRGLRRISVALTLAAALVTACGAQPAGDPGFRKTRDSNYGQIGDVVLLHVHLATPPERDWQPGVTVPLHLTLTNGGDRPATLTAVDSPAATGGVTYPGADGVSGPVRIPVAAGATVSMQETDPTHPSLVGLASVLRGGLTVPVTFTLDTGESVTLAVPAQTSAEPAR